MTHSTSGCQHPEVSLRVKIASNGAKMAGHQCVTCGCLVGKYVKKHLWPKTMERWSDELRVTYREIRDKELSLLWLEKREEYEEYIVSLKWLRKREEILKRDGNLCQRCKAYPATDVHHLTYANLGNEPPEDLISVCRGCHEEIHGRKFA